ncbi:glycosyltransferase, partial [Escherichia coli]
MIYIVVLNWNGAIDTINCVKSLMDLNVSDYKIIIVDNCSMDNSYDTIKENLNSLYIADKSIIEVKYEDRNKYKTLENDKIILIQSPQNNGYASGNNIGIEFALNQ